MTFPTLKVEVAFGYDPLDTAATWTDITDYVSPKAPVKITRGRNDPWSPFRAGQATLLLDDFAERRFDPTYTAGPYYGDLKPRVQIRIQATVSATDYPVFRGWVTSWPQQLDGSTPMAGSVELVCYDALEWAASARLTDDLYADYVDAIGTELVWLRQVDASWSDAAGSDYAAKVQAGTLTAAGSLGAGLQSSAAAFNGSTWLTPANRIYIDGSTDDWTYAFWVSTTGVSQPISYRKSPTAFLISVICEIDADGKLHFDTKSSGIGALWETDIVSSMAVNDGSGHFVVITNNAGTLTLYIDGAADTAAAYSYGYSGSLADLGIDRWCANGATFTDGGLGPDDPTVMFNGNLQELVVTTGTAWSATQVDAAYKYGIGFLAESSADRMGRVLDSAGWPSAWRDITTDPRSEVGRLVYNGQQLVTALREIESSEQGKVFAAKNGYLTMLGRYHHQDVTRGKTVQATFSDDGSDYPYESWRYLETDSDVRNDVTVTTPTTQSRSTDSTSISTYGRQSETVDTILSTFTQAKDMAAGLVYRWKNASGRVAPFWVDPTHGGSWVTLLGLELADRIQVEATPMGVGSQLVKELLVDSIEWEIWSWVWRLRLGGAPVPAKTFVLGESALDGSDPLGF